MIPPQRLTKAYPRGPDSLIWLENIKIEVDDAGDLDYHQTSSALECHHICLSLRGKCHLWNWIPNGLVNGKGVVNACITQALIDEPNANRLRRFNVEGTTSGFSIGDEFAFKLIQELLAIN